MGLRTWLLRRATGRFHIGDDLSRALDTYRRADPSADLEVAGARLPVSARAVARAVRTRAASQLGADWVWPHWLERQLDPTSPAFVPPGDLPLLANVTDRSWTRIGNLDSPRSAVVDRRGLVTPWPGAWSLDWWIGADDRWHLPAREPSVRQGLLDATPVVETRMRVPGGDAVHRAYAVRTPAVPGRREGDELVVVEIANESAVPFAVALAVRPYDTEGLAVVERIDLRGTTVRVDGQPALLLPKAPGRVAASTFEEGDSATLVTGGEATERFPPNLRCPAGLAQAALVLPLAHGATLRVAMPMDPGPRRRRPVPGRRGRHRGVAAPLASLPAALPPASSVAAGWRSQTDRGMRLELPDPRLQDAVDANRRHVLLARGDAATPAGSAAGHRSGVHGTATLVAALDRYGFAAEAAEAVASLTACQRADGSLCRDGEPDATGAALWATGQHWRLTRDRTPFEHAPGSIAGALQWIERSRRTGRRGDPALRGLLPPSRHAGHLGTAGWSYAEAFWGIAGMEAGAELLGALGETDGAADARRRADSFRGDVEASLELTAARLRTAAVPAGPRRRIDAGAVGSLAACWPLGVLPVTDPRIAATAEAVRDGWCQGPAVLGPLDRTGLAPQLSLQLAGVELEAGDRRALERLAWVLDAATPTWTWPEALHPRLPGGCAGDGHHLATAAELLSFVRSMLVREVPGGLAVASMVPDPWLGQGWEVHDAPTAVGRLSYAVRWHGERPALLWELEAHSDVADVRITAPGLDPAWSSHDRRGDALLAAPSWAEPLATSVVAPAAPSARPQPSTPVEPGESFG
jgi:hypothetical protein